jgi:ATP-dependent DNA helicase RecG
MSLTEPPFDLPGLLQRGKGAGLHWYPEDVPVARLAATLVGMANSSGGVVVLGVSPHSGQMLGLAEPEAMIDRVFQAALLADPPLVLPLPQEQRVGQVRLLLVTVPPGLPHVYNLEGRYLGREGAQTNPLPARRLRQLLLERGAVQFESQSPPDATLDDLDPQQVAAYLAALQLPAGELSEVVLLRRGCLQRVRPEPSTAAPTAPTAPTAPRYRPTYAALLLFGRRPQQWLPSAVILAVRFAGTTFGDQFIKQEIGGSLPEQLRQAELFLRDNLRQVVRMKGLTHAEVLEYPFDALRELIVNAVAHRDYSLQGDTIHLNIFADRLEISSPGGLPGPVTLNNLLEARFSRNAVIVQALADLGFVERLGYGLDRVVELLRQASLRPPRFEEVAGSFRVTLSGEPAQAAPSPGLARYQNLAINPRQEQALVFIAAHRRISNSDLQDLCPDVHPETLRRDLVDLVNRGVLIKIGDKRATYYVLK